MLKEWNSFFKKIKKKKYIKLLKIFLDNEYKKYKIYPPRKLIFNAFKQTSPKQIKIIIIGQDPYHEINQAMGLAFSVFKKTNIPPSLKNIFKEIENEYHCKMTKNGDLTYLANQGCLLFNTILTVREHQPLSHNIREYQLFTLDVLKYINELKQPIVFMLWGNKAKQYIKYISKKNKRLILTSSHPSPLSSKYNWFGNNHFKKANFFLKKNKVKEINWLNE